MRPIPRLALLVGAASLLPSGAEAQYFGRNKVQYESFDFRILRSPHFDNFFYPAESLAVADAARMAERWYERHRDVLDNTIGRRALVFYADHPDFQQTNVIGGFIDQGTGGVTEGLRGRVVMPFTGVYADNDHVLGHELVHVMQYDIANEPNTGGMNAMGQLPLWIVEGMAEYLSIGRDDPHTAMWLRDAALRNELPTIRQLTTDPRFFPYRFGQAFWAWVGGRWGDAVIAPLYRQSLRGGLEPAVRRVLGISTDSLSKQWMEGIRTTYLPVLEGRSRPMDVGERILERQGRDGEMDFGPALSPDGRWVAFYSRRGLFSIDLFIADARTGKVRSRLTSPNTDPHFSALSFINSSGSWSPDGRRFAHVVFADGDHEIDIWDVERRRTERRIKVSGVGAVSDPAWGPNDQIAFSGMAGGISDLYVLDLASERVTRLTDDRHADLQPAWSPDGRTIAFASDRAPETDFGRLVYGPLRIALYDVQSGQVRSLRIFEDAKHINPQWSPDGSALFFVSDRGGFSDVYRMAVQPSGEYGPVTQVTRLATGISGITKLSPALSVARESGRMVFSVFHKAGQTLRRLEAGATAGSALEPLPAGPAVAGILPPVQPRGRELVAAALADPAAGLPATDEAFTVRRYQPSFSLDYIGSPGVGFAAGGGGTAVAGGIQAYFADPLNDRIIGTALGVNGQSFKDTGGEIVYFNQKRRWNWFTGASHTPYLTGFTDVRDTTITVGSGSIPALVVSQQLLRVYVDELSAGTQYPFSQTRRVETNVRLVRLGYDVDVQNIIAANGQVIGEYRENGESPPGVSYGQGALAMVADWSYFGFTSPVAGGRWRLEAGPTFGTLNFQTALADYRRYFFVRPFTFAMRGLGYARFGRDGEDERLSPLYIGQNQLVRGYDVNSIGPEECSQAVDGGNACPEFERLIGSRIAVASMELRVPLFGTREYGLIPTSFLPVEIAPFVDAGVAWTRDERPELRFARRSAERVPVVSAGLSARVNLFGYAVGEVFWAYPFQRPERGGHIGFQLAPGW